MDQDKPEAEGQTAKPTRAERIAKFRKDMEEINAKGGTGSGIYKADMADGEVWRLMNSKGEDLKRDVARSAAGVTIAETLLDDAKAYNAKMEDGVELALADQGAIRMYGATYDALFARYARGVFAGKGDNKLLDALAMMKVHDAVVLGDAMDLELLAHYEGKVEMLVPVMRIVRVDPEKLAKDIAADPDDQDWALPAAFNRVMLSRDGDGTEEDVTFVNGKFVTAEDVLAHIRRRNRLLAETAGDDAAAYGASEILRHRQEMEDMEAEEE